MKISCCVSQPDGIDYPLFRDRMPQLLEHVDEVLICFNRWGHKDISDWITKHTPGIKVVPLGSYPGDWRNKSTKSMIKEATGDYILSLEQDFLIKDYDHFFTTVKNAKSDIVMFQEYNEIGGRFHPAFLLVKKKLLRDNFDYSVMGRGKDHFAMVTKKLKTQKYVSLEDLGLLPGKDWFHMRGLSDNYRSPKPYYDLNNFYYYNEACKDILPMTDYWKGEMERCSGEYKDAEIERFL